MFSRLLFAGAAALAMLVPVSHATAQDTHKLSLPASMDAPTRNLKATDADLDADTISVARGGFRGGSIHAGGFRGGVRGGFYRGAVGYRGFAGYRGFGGYRGISGYRGVYGYRGYGYGRYGYGRYGYGYGRYGYGGYYPGWGLASYWWPGYSYGYYPYYSYYYPSTYYVYPDYYYYPSVSYSYPSTVIPSMPPAGTSLYSAPPPVSQPPSVPSTFEYDGGPKLPVPLPPGEEKMTRLPNHPTLITDLAVSAKSGKWNYPAYGEKATRTPRYGVQPSLIVGTLP